MFSWSCIRTYEELVVCSSKQPDAAAISSQLSKKPPVHEDVVANVEDTTRLPDVGGILPRVFT